MLRREILIAMNLVYLNFLTNVLLHFMYSIGPILCHLMYSTLQFII